MRKHRNRPHVFLLNICPTIPRDPLAIEKTAVPLGRLGDQDDHDNSVSTSHITDLGRFLTAIFPELSRRACESGAPLPVELGVSQGDARFMIHVDRKSARVEPDKLSRRHLAVTPATMVRLLMGHVDVDQAAEEPGFTASTSTALDAARVLFTPAPIWRSPLDSGTA